MKIADRKYLNLLREMTLAQFKLRDQSTFFGFLWSFLNPLIVLSLLFAVFSSRLSGDIEYYGLYLLIGIVHYTYFSNATTASMQVLYSMKALTRDAIFPKDVLVLASIITHTIDFVLSMLICVVLAIFSGVKLTGAMAALPFVFVMPQSPLDIVLFGSLGLLGGAGHYLVIRAFQSGPAAVIAPLGYVELIGTATLGYLIFGNFPDAWTWLGAAIIIASGLYIALRERRRRSAAR